MTDLKKRPNLDEKLTGTYTQFEALLNELDKKELPDEIVQTINQEIDQVNRVPDAGSDLKKQVKKSQARILKLIEKKLKLVTKNHYRNTWLAVGMSVFGIPLGVAFGASLGNMAFLAIGLPIGMTIGIAVGTAMDKKAAEEGRQLDINLS